jgi:hypothetical protein
VRAAQDSVDPAAIVPRTAGQGIELHHPDDRFSAGFDQGEEFAHG